GLLQQRKRRLVLSDFEGDDATSTEQDIDLEALHTLASKSLGGDSTDKAAGYGAAEVPADATMPFWRRRLMKPFTSFTSAHVPENIPAGAVVDKGKAPMVDDSLPADLLSEQERILKNLHDYQLGEDLAKKLHTEQEAEFARQQDELAQKTQAEHVASPTEHGPGLSDQRRRELDATQLIYTKADWVPASVPAAPSFAADVSVSAATTPSVLATESRPADTPTASAHVSVEHFVVASTHSSLRRRRKHIAKRRVTPIVDIADAALIKFDSDSGSDDDPLPWRLYPRAQVHILETVDGRVIYMFVDVSYPLSAAILERMLKHGLEVTQNWMAFIFHVPFWNEKWLVQRGTALGPEQRATGKDVSNPFMAVMVCQKPLAYFSSSMIHVPRAELVFNPPEGRYIDSGCSRHMTGNMSYLSNFEEINGGYVAFGGNPKGGKISSKGKIKTGKLDFDDVYFVKELKFNLFSLSDENQVLLRVPRENNMYYVDLKNIIPSQDLTCLFAKATLDESNLWHRRLGHINFKIMNKLVKGKFDGKVDEGFLVGYSVSIKEPEFEGRKPESEVYVSPSSSAQTKKHDDKTKRKAKGKSHVELSTGYRNLSAEFEDFSDNSINEVNAAGTLVFAVGKISTNSTNTFSAAGPYNTAVKDITYSDDEEDVGAEADFTNLETTITVSPIPTTRVRKDHNVTKIIGDLSLATQTRSMTRVVKDQGGATLIQDAEGLVARIEAVRLFLAYASFMGFMVYQMDVKSAFLYGTIEEEVYVCQPPRFEDPDYPDKVYKVVKAQYGLHQAPRAWYETLANYLLENGFQRRKIEKTLFIKRQKVKQKPNGIFISHDKYVADILRKFGLTDGKSTSTPIDTKKPLLKDPDVDEKVGIEVSAVDLKVFAVRLIVTANVNDVIGLQALIDRKKVIITEATVRQALRLDDAESIDCLPNEEIFTELSRMGYEKPFTKLTFYKAFFSPQWKFLIHTILQCMSAKRTSWNEFSSSMASAVIFLSTSRKFNFSMYIFDSLVRNVDSSTKFYMYLRFLQLMIRTQVGKGFSRVETPLFEGMIVVQQVAQQADDVANEGAASVDIDDVPAAAAEPSITSPTPTTQPPPPSQELPSTSQGEIIANMDADEDVTLKDVFVVAKEVEVEKDTEIEENADVQGRQAESQAQIYKIDLEYADKVLSIQDDELEPANLKERKEKEDNVVLRYQALKRKPQMEAQARKNMMIYLRNMDGFKMDYFKGMSYDDIHPIFEKLFNSNVAFLDKTKEQMEEEDNRALKRTSESLEEKAVKKQKLDEEVEELKKHLQIVLNNDDDVYTEATPLDLKVRVVDYAIHTENNKPYFKIIRADGTHQLFLSFLSLLSNFNREELEVLWQIVKEGFASSKPKNFSDDFLLTTLTYMFEKPNVQAKVWKNQRYVHGLAKVKSWRLLESCGVHIITFTTTQMILLVERRYPLTRFTLDQMLNNNYYCQVELMLLDNAVDIKLRLLEQSAVVVQVVSDVQIVKAVSIKVNNVMYKLRLNPCTCLMGQPSLDDYEYYPKSNYYAKPPIKGRENQQRRSFVCLEVVTKNDEYTQEQSSTELFELFHGFLAIGTLGTDQISSGASTPTFSTSSARTSYVSNGRSSHGSTITLSRKPLEVVAMETENGLVAFLLQGYLLSSTVGQPKTTSGKKEQRTSLGELFLKTRLAEKIAYRNETGLKSTRRKKVISLMSS
nr:hypothetical protein [Tanacetum cinerariifolium]